MSLRDGGQRTVGCGEITPPEREPRDEADAVLGAVVEQLVALALTSILGRYRLEFGEILGTSSQRRTASRKVMETRLPRHRRVSP